MTAPVNPPPAPSTPWSAGPAAQCCSQRPPGKLAGPCFALWGQLDTRAPAMDLAWGSSVKSQHGVYHRRGLWRGCSCWRGFQNAAETPPQIHLFPPWRRRQPAQGRPPGKQLGAPEEERLSPRQRRTHLRGPGLRRASWGRHGTGRMHGTALSPASDPAGGDAVALDKSVC